MQLAVRCHFCHKPCPRAMVTPYTCSLMGQLPSHLPRHYFCWADDMGSLRVWNREGHGRQGAWQTFLTESAGCSGSISTTGSISGLQLLLLLPTIHPVWHFRVPPSLTPSSPPATAGVRLRCCSHTTPGSDAEGRQGGKAQSKGIHTLHVQKNASGFSLLTRSIP